VVVAVLPTAVEVLPQLLVAAVHLVQQVPLAAQEL
jgi:hypothetical protein